MKITEEYFKEISNQRQKYNDEICKLEDICDELHQENIKPILDYIVDNYDDLKMVGWNDTIYKDIYNSERTLMKIKECDDISWNCNKIILKTSGHCRGYDWDDVYYIDPLFFTDIEAFKANVEQQQKNTQQAELKRKEDEYLKLKDELNKN